MGSDDKSVVDVAGEAERAAWKHYGIEVKERFVEVSAAKRRVRMLECGNPNGEPLVFVQGGLGEALGWVGLMAELGDYRCISLDRPGSGFSDGIDFTEVDIPALATETLGAVLDAHDLEAASFAANSMGGWWTLRFAMARPKRVSRMVLIGCPALLLHTSAPVPMRLVGMPVLGKAMASLMVPTSPAKARDVPGFLGHPKSVGAEWPEALAEAYYRLGNLPDFKRSWHTLLRCFLRLSGPNPAMSLTAEALREVAQPTRFLWGKADPFGDLAAAREAVEAMPNASLEVVGTGHLPWWDEPARCAEHVREFVQ